MNILNWLGEWYRSNCGESAWDNVDGINICTLDNPGWLVEIELSETSLAGALFEQISIDNGEDDWLECRVINNVFEGGGDIAKLEEILLIFKKWVTEQKVQGDDTADDEHV